MAAEATRPFRHLSPSIAPKQHFLTVDLTVKLARPGAELPVFKCLQVLETIGGSDRSHRILVCSSAQPALVIALTERHTPRA
jgi:hypothetical protein